MVFPFLVRDRDHRPCRGQTYLMKDVTYVYSKRREVRQKVQHDKKPYSCCLNEFLISTDCCQRRITHCVVVGERFDDSAEGTPRVRCQIDKYNLPHLLSFSCVCLTKPPPLLTTKIFH